MQVMDAMESELQQLTEKWQKLLRIQDWQIDVSFGNPAHGSIEAMGKTECNPYELQADIVILDPSKFEHDNWEETLLHELVHIVLDDWDHEHGTPEHKSVEIAVTRIVSALLAMDNLNTD